MQRKNSYVRKRNGSAMLMAIFFIVILSTIMAISLSMSSETTKRTVDVYLYEKAALLAKSAAEYAVLRIGLDNNSTNPCNVTSLNFTQDGFDVNVSVLYSYKDPLPSSCNGKTFAKVTTEEQNGTALIDVAVTSNLGTEPIRYVRRSLQKL